MALLKVITYQASELNYADSVSKSTFIPNEVISFFNSGLKIKNGTFSIILLPTVYINLCYSPEFASLV